MHYNFYFKFRSKLSIKKNYGIFSKYLIVEEDYDDELNSFLKPEFKGRLDCLLNFNSLKELIINRLLVENLGARSVAKIFREKIKTKIATEIINENIPFGSKLIFTVDKNSDNFILSVNYQSTINENWFPDAFTAQEYAKSDPTILITRSPCGNGYIVKK